MTFKQMLLSSRVLVSLAIVFLISAGLTYFPLIGTLGFEYSAFMAFVMAFICVFISAELVNIDLTNRKRGRRLSDLTTSIFIINFIVLAIPFVVGLLSSLIKKDCYLLEGSIFFLLISTVTVFFSTALGMLTGYVLRRRGFFIGSLILLGTVVYALWHIYKDISLFVYSPVFGFFPGPLYDEAIPVTLTLVIYRVIIVFWGILFMLLLRLANGLRYKRIGIWDFISISVVAAILIISHSHKSEIGISYTRDHVTQNVLSASVETDHFIIYYVPGTPESKYIDLIKDDHEWRYKQLAEYLDVDSEDKIRSYIYPDAEIRKKITGAGETTIANPIHKEIHLIYNSFPHPILKHELTHVMAGDFGTDFLRMSPKVGLLEGIAVAADWSGDGYTRHQYAKSMIRRGMAPAIQDLVGFGFWYAPAPISYTLMGSFSRFLIDTYGIDNFKHLYKTGDFSVYGKSLDELAGEWLEFLKGVYIPEETEEITEAKFSAPSIFTATCPRRVASLRTNGFKHFSDDNYFKARELFSRALGYNPTDPVLINGLSYAHYYDGNYDEVGEVIKNSGIVPKVDKRILYNLRANALWQEGNTQEAAEIFKAVRNEALPDDLKRELDIKLSAINKGGQSEQKIREFFGTRDRVIQEAALQELIRSSPGYSPAYYLIGRQFFNNQQFEKALPYLNTAGNFGLPSDKLEKENLRILGITQFSLGNYDDAVKTFKKLSTIADTEVSKNYALDFIERLKWADENNLN